MLNKKTPRQEQLDKVVESKIKGIGLDALFHIVDAGKKDRRSSSRDSSGNQDKPSFLRRLKSGLRFLAPQNIRYRLENIYSDRPHFIIGISFDSIGVKIIELEEIKGAVRLNNVQHIPVPHALANSEEKTEEFITSTVAEILDPQTTKHAYICSVIPRSKVMTKFFSLPTADPVEIENMVDLEAEHHVPFPLNECIFDYDVLYYENSKAHIVFVTIRKEEIKKHLQLLEKAGVQPSAVDISAFSLHSTLQWEKDVAGRTIHLYIGPDHIDINVVKDGRLKASRAIPWGSASLTSTLCTHLNVNREIAEKMQKENGIVIKKTLKNDIADTISGHTCVWAAKLINEIKETIRHFHFQDGLSDIDRIIMTGEGSRLLNLNEYLQDQLNTRVFRQEPPEMFEESGSNEPFRRLFSELSPLAGLAGKFNKERSTGVNLLPHNLRYTFEQKKQSMRQLATLSITALAFLVMMLLPAAAISVRDRYISHMDQKIAQLEPRATELLALSDKVQTIEDYRSVSRSCIEVLREISLLVSMDILIDQFTFEQNDHVSLVGEAESHVSVVDLSRAIRESELFENAVLKYTRKKDRLKKNVDFEIICKIKK